MIENGIRFGLLVLLLAVASGCASRPMAPVEDRSQPSEQSSVRDRSPRPTVEPIGKRMADVALEMVGTPYRYGGANPAGFDCSGLVFYSYDQLGIRVPRTSTEQRRAATRIDVEQLRKGDLVFFRTLWKSGHVGIFVGDGQFVHAPSSGKSVEMASLSTGYFASRLQSVGRLH